MSKYRLISMASAALIIIAGLIYLSTDGISPAAVLPICIVAICGMGAASALEARKANTSGIVAYIPALCFFVLAAFVTAALVFLLIK